MELKNDLTLLRGRLSKQVWKNPVLTKVRVERDCRLHLDVSSCRLRSIDSYLLIFLLQDSSELQSDTISYLLQFSPKCMITLFKRYLSLSTYCWENRIDLIGLDAVLGTDHLLFTGWCRTRRPYTATITDLLYFPIWGLFVLDSLNRALWQ
jgi:hypothetical protein